MGKKILNPNYSSSQLTKINVDYTNFMFENKDNFKKKHRHHKYFYERNYHSDIYNSKAALSNIKMMDNYLNLVQIMSGNKYWYSTRELLLFNQMILEQEENSDNPPVTKETFMDRLIYYLELFINSYKLGSSYNINDDIDIFIVIIIPILDKLSLNRFQNDLSLLFSNINHLYNEYPPRTIYITIYNTNLIDDLVFTSDLIIPNNSNLFFGFNFTNMGFTTILVNMKNINNYTLKLDFFLNGNINFIGTTNNDNIVTEGDVNINPGGGNDSIIINTDNENTVIAKTEDGILNVVNPYDNYAEVIYLYNDPYENEYYYYGYSNDFYFYNQDPNDIIYYTGDIIFSGETSNLIHIDWTTMKDNIPDDILNI